MACTTGSSSTRSCAVYPTDLLGDTGHLALGGAAVVLRRSATATSSSSARRSTCSGSTDYKGDPCPVGRTPTYRLRRQPRRPRHPHPVRRVQGRDVPQPRPAGHRHGMGGPARRPDPIAASPRRRLRHPAALRHGERRGVRRRGRPGWAGPRPGTGRVHRQPLARRARGDGDRGRRSRVLPVVPARQLRVGLRVCQAVRHRARRLRHPGPHPQTSALHFANVAATGRLGPIEA